jgi:hypothetical protein
MNKELLLNMRSVFTISDDVRNKLTTIKRNKSLTTLDRYQTSLLFHYLNVHGVILDFDNISLATIIEVLTAHSAHNIRTECLNQIPRIIKDKEKDHTHNESNYNLITVREILRAVISDIEKEIENNGKD